MESSSVASRLASGLVYVSLLAAAAAKLPPRVPSQPHRAAAAAVRATTPALAHRDIVGTEGAQFSHGAEELVIRDFFQDMRKGVFLDVGCGHPIQGSNTYYLEKFLGWSGIGVDALPEMAEKWRNKRPASRFFNFLVTDRTVDKESFYRAEHWDVSSVDKPGDKEAYAKLHFDEIQVPATTLTALLDDAGVARIDLLSMDIEGHEPKALAGFDIDRFKPRLVCIEAKPATRAAILQYFKTHGYEQIERYLEYDAINYYFTPIAPGR